MNFLKYKQKKNNVKFVVDNIFDYWNPSTVRTNEETSKLQEKDVENKPHLVIFHESVLVSLWNISLNLRT